MIYFIESSFPAFLTNYIKKGIFFCTPNAYKYAPTQKYLFCINSPIIFNTAKILFSILRFNCTFQGGFGLAYSMSWSKSVISDGILTEWLSKEGYIKPKQFLSISTIRPTLPVSKGQHIILGNNFYEFGSFSLNKYQKYLEYLSLNFPNAYYFPHPKEASDLPKEIFKSKYIESNLNIESYCTINGIPENIIGFVGSTSVASLAHLAKDPIRIVAIKVHANDYDGPVGDITDPQLLTRRGIKVTTSILENMVIEIVSDLHNVTLDEYSIQLR